MTPHLDHPVRWLICGSPRAPTFKRTRDVPGLQSRWHARGAKTVGPTNKWPVPQVSNRSARRTWSRRELAMEMGGNLVPFCSLGAAAVSFGRGGQRARFVSCGLPLRHLSLEPSGIKRNNCVVFESPARPSRGVTEILAATTLANPEWNVPVSPCHVPKASHLRCYFNLASSTRVWPVWTKLGTSSTTTAGFAPTFARCPPMFARPQSHVFTRVRPTLAKSGPSSAEVSKSLAKFGR